MDLTSTSVEILVHAYHFARNNQYIVDLAPLQLYTSALVFAPDLSIIKTLFKSCMPSWLARVPKIEGSWHNDMLKFVGHTDEVTAIAFSPDDNLLGTCSFDRTARLWDTTDANCSLTVSYHESDFKPVAIAFSPDSSKISVAYWKMQVKKRNLVLNTVVTVTYNTKTGVVFRRSECLRAPEGWIGLAVAFEDFENTVLATRDHNEVQLWRFGRDPHRLVQSWTSHIESPRSFSPAVAISHDASLLCCQESSNVVREHKTVVVFDLKKGVLLGRYDWALSNLPFSGLDPIYHATSAISGVPEIRCLDIETGKSRRVCNFPDDQKLPLGLAHAKDRFAFREYRSNTVYMETLSPNKRFNASMELTDKASLDIVAVAPKGDLVVVLRGKRLEVLDSRGFVQKIFPFGTKDYSHPGAALTISPDGQYVAHGQSTGTLLWSIEDGNCMRYDGMECSYLQCFSYDNSSMACDRDHDITIWSLRPERMLLWQIRKPRDRYLTHLRFSADGEVLSTDQGRLHIASATWTPESTPMSATDIDLSRPHPPRAQVDWVLLGDEGLVWIPDAHRCDPRKGSARGGTVALGQDDGSVMIMEFRDPTGKYEIGEQ